MDYSKLRTSLILFSGILACGTFGYAIVDDMPLYDALYMTIITISTVGFSEIRPLSPGGRAITIFIIVTGISLGTYTLGLFVRIFVEGELQHYLGRRKLLKKLRTLKTTASSAVSGASAASCVRNWRRPAFLSS